VTLTATADTGWRFANWDGDCAAAGSATTATVTLVASRTCTATFVRRYTLTVTKTGDGAANSGVTSTPSGIACGSTCAATYDAGTAVTLTPDPIEGYEFVSWSGTGCTTGTVTLTSDRTCTAVFEAVVVSCGIDGELAQACLADGGRWDEETCSCRPYWEDPLVLTLDGSPLRLTDVAGGVGFDVNGDGVREPVAWTRAWTAAAFLVVDLDGDGAITTSAELFGMPVGAPRRGKPAPQENSFTLLGAYDTAAQGGNGDGVISAADGVFSRLRVWIDTNHDGVSQPGELLPLAAAGITSIELTYQPTGRRDGHGNYYRYRGVVHLASGATIPIWDVFLAVGLAGHRAPSAAGLTGPPGMPPVGAILAGLSAVLIAVGLVGIPRGRGRHGRPGPCVSPRRLHGAATLRLGTTGVTTLAVVLLWPSALFGQTWQVVEYYDTDAVGSVRAVTDAQGQVVARHDFLPFGEELNPQTPPHDKKLFTGQERDFETGQDYFGARQLRTDLGRFLALDPIILVPREL
jgi:RHS repeat-associated protein